MKHVEKAWEKVQSNGKSKSEGIVTKALVGAGSKNSFKKWNITWKTEVGTKFYKRMLLMIDESLM